MGKLIEGLLELARISRTPLHLRFVNLSDVCHRIEGEMRERDPARNIRIDIQADLLAHGDPLLLEAVMNNLIGNAWKFTSKKEHAEIGIGCEVDADGTGAYFVKDNGVGFDMVYASKLFATFERLHAPGDFTGSGIGLATVKRIISRHGGRIWAHAVAGEGARFYFTLSPGLFVPALTDPDACEPDERLEA